MLAGFSVFFIRLKIVAKAIAIASNVIQRSKATWESPK